MNDQIVGRSRSFERFDVEALKAACPMPQIDFQNVAHTASTDLHEANLRMISPALCPPCAGGLRRVKRRNASEESSSIHIMTTQLGNSTTDQTNDDETDLDTAINDKCAEIRALLPALKRLGESFGELHELLDEDDRVADFDTWCQHEFGVIPELLLEATERL